MYSTSSRWGTWLTGVSTWALRCPRCEERGTPDWLPSRRRPELWWSRCARCEGIAIWLGGQLEQPCGEAVIPREQQRSLALLFLRHATDEQRIAVRALSAMRANLTLHEQQFAEVGRFLTTFLLYRHGLRRGSPATDLALSTEGPEPAGEGRTAMSDERVLEAAQADESAIQRRIEELREEIERTEVQLQEIGDFIRKYREYERVAQPTPAY